MTGSKKDYPAYRREYKKSKLDKSDLLENPLAQFENWLVEATREKEHEPLAMTLATVSNKGKPSARTVLLKEVEENGFVFYSHYHSRKGREIELNPFGALVFFWPGIERQVRIEGTIEKINGEKSDAYFLSRPEDSRRGAWASPQSQPIANRRYLEDLYAGVEDEKLNQRPPYWGGYRLVPSSIEFWQGRPSRLNDRFLYKKVNTAWEITRLAP